jgi:fumarate hydratase class II
VNETWIRTDSLKTLQLKSQQDIIDQQKKAIERMKKNLNTSIAIGGTAVGVTILVTVVCLLRK